MSPLPARLPRVALALALVLTPLAARAAPPATAPSARPAPERLDGHAIPKFVEPLPTFVGARVGGPLVGATMTELRQKVLPASFYAGLTGQHRQGTEVWGYELRGLDAVTGRPVVRGPSYPGTTVEARRGVPTVVRYANELRTPTLQKRLPVDQTFGWADPKGLGCALQASPSMACLKQYSGPVPMVVHLHGGEVPPAFDGGPDQWFTISGRHGANYGTLLPVGENEALYRYPNLQEATALWFHDHALGTTRLNVYGGVAAFYLLRDAQDTGRADNPLRLPAGAQELEIVVQDRAFDVDGELLYTDPAELPNPDVHPYWRPEFFGDVIVVNGKSWPRLDAEPRRYRLRLLNGSNARFYRLALRNEGGGGAPPFWQIGTDGGRLDAPVRLESLLLAPGERADVLLDLTAFPGATFTVTNDANSPFPGGDPVDPETSGLVLQLRVGRHASSADASCDPAASGPGACTLRPGAPIVRLAADGALAPGVRAAARRQLILREIGGPGGPLQVLVNNTNWEGMKASTLTTQPQPIPDSLGVGETFVTETPRVGSTEVWEVANLTEDAHPIHLHLVQFQLMARESLDSGFDEATGEPFGYVKEFLAALPPSADPAAEPPGDGPPNPYAQPNGDGAVGGNPAFGPYLLHDAAPPGAEEAGWKDTVVMYPGMVTRIAVRFAPQGAPIAAARPGLNLYPFDPALVDPGERDRFGNPGAAGYVWHCHILEHEDNDMMRPYALLR